MDEPSAPKRRLHVTLDMGADDIEQAANALWDIARDLEIEGREDRDVTSGGWASGYHLTVTVTDPDMDGDRFRAELKEWVAERRRRLDAEAG